MNKFGLDEKGFKRARYKDVVDSMNDRAKELWGEDINISERSPLGLIIRITSFFIGNLWQLAENVYNSAFKDTATGTSLDKVAEYIGITRRNATFARGEVTFLGENDIIVVEGTVVGRVDEFQYTTTETVTIQGGTTTVSVVARERGPGGNAPMGTVTEIINPIEGLDSVSNSDAITGGLEVETDAELRARYDESVAKVGSSTTESIRATILDLEDVRDVIVEENVTINPMGDMPPKSIAPLVLGGVDEDIARSIFDTKAGGIQSYGTTEIEVIDSLGNPNTIGFTRPTTVDITVDLSLVTDSRFPLDGNNMVEEAIIKYIGGVFNGIEYLGLGLGEDVIYTRVISAIHSVEGITDIPTLTLNGLSENISIDTREVATISNVVIT